MIRAIVSKDEFNSFCKKVSGLRVRSYENVLLKIGIVGNKIVFVYEAGDFDFLKKKLESGF